MARVSVQDFRTDMTHLTCCECGAWFWGPLLIVDGEYDLCSDECVMEWRSHGSVPRPPYEPPRMHRGVGRIIRAEMRPELVIEE